MSQNLRAGDHSNNFQIREYKHVENQQNFFFHLNNQGSGYETERDGALSYKPKREVLRILGCIFYLDKSAAQVVDIGSPAPILGSRDPNSWRTRILFEEADGGRFPIFLTNEYSPWPQNSWVLVAKAINSSGNHLLYGILSSSGWTLANVQTGIHSFIYYLSSREAWAFYILLSVIAAMSYFIYEFATQYKDVIGWLWTTLVLVILFLPYFRRGCLKYEMKVRTTAENS